MRHTFRQASPADHDLIAGFMRDFYAAIHLPLGAANLAAMKTLLAWPELGQIVIVEDDHTAAGYFAMTFAFSLERGGKTALLDELFILPAHRNRGLASAAIQFAITLAREQLCRTLLLEVDHGNPQAHSLYTRLGFATLPRHYLSLAL